MISLSGAHRIPSRSKASPGPRWWRRAVTLVVILALPAVAHAYVGPGAGVAFVTTALLLLTTIILSLLGLLSWPVRQIYRLLTRKRPPNPPRITRAVVVGLDGLDPELTTRFMEAGHLPHLQRLAEQGTFTKLGTTYPAMSPVAWSTFATGVSPAKHGIFDFLTRDPRSYQPELSSAQVGAPRRQVRLGPYVIPVGRPQVRLRRKSRPFWKILGDHQVPATVLRVPITFPPERFDGMLLSAMCVPDIRGTQGSFTYFTSGDAANDEVGATTASGEHAAKDDARPDGERAEHAAAEADLESGGSAAVGAGEGAGQGSAEGGERVTLSVDGDTLTGVLSGPDNPMRPDAGRLELPFTLRRRHGHAELTIGRETRTLEVGRYSDWVPVAFPMGLGLRLRGICRFRLLELEPQLRLYVSPINIDPSHPILPIAHPFIFSVFLAKLCGRFATLGLAEDTWALNDRVLDEEAFLEQAWDHHAERESMFFEMLRRTPKGLTACVFDGTDRIQHMFMRYLDERHPARAGDPEVERYAGVIEETYRRCDEMIGRVLDEVDASDPETLVLVISDHGFRSFRRGVNLNAWLREHGYLVLREGTDGSGPWHRDVDWSQTRAFALGLGGIFLNLQGREAAGIVAPGTDAEELASTLARALTGLEDAAGGGTAIKEAYATRELYRGPYLDEAPDLIVGYGDGWRASWGGAKGVAAGPIFSDNTRPWSGDHCIDPELVPGVLFCNQQLTADEEPCTIADLAPTLLNLFGVPPPRYMDGRSLRLS